nr:AAA family ATPase [Mammaliicoccus sp. Marseille-Q6498]
MGLISPKKEKNYIYFDKIPRKQILQKFWSLVLASGWAESAENFEEKREIIQNKLKDFFDIAQENGASTYGNDVKTQFQKQYTMGFDTGIWVNSELDLSESARQVFDGYITPREYITRFVCNLFEYVKDVGYVHPLYETCKYAIDNNKMDLEKADFFNILPLTSDDESATKEYPQHINMFINYLKATNLFEEGKNLIKFRDEFPPKIVIQFCNIDYKNEDKQETMSFFKSYFNYSKYISQQLPKKYYEILNDTITMNEPVAQKLEIKDNSRVLGGKNKIYYGAPGTGKSYKVDKEYTGYKRVTFHPEYTYYDFIGGLRPVQDEVSGNIKYEFVPGPFTDVLIDAIFDEENFHGIIIEELNRANTAAVFGDIFQLLDRDDDGNSKYSITNKEITDYIKKIKNVNIEEIIIPSNLSIIATMNSADQGVNVLDSAFKRRWQFEYTQINFNEPDLDKVILAGFDIPWNDFGKILNNHLSRNGIDEDKLIGQRFITKKEIEDKELVASKLLIYLWDDVFRYNRKLIFKEHSVFSRLVDEYYENGIDCFVSSLSEELSKYLNSNSENKEQILDNKEEYSTIDEDLNDD